MRRRSNKLYDPAIVKAVSAFENDEAFWESVWGRTRQTLLDLDSRAAVERAGQERIDAVCDAFAQIVDAKSPFTAERPYRGALPLEQVFAILDKDAGSALDADCIEALRRRYPATAGAPLPLVA